MFFRFFLIVGSLALFQGCWPSCNSNRVDSDPKNNNVVVILPGLGSPKDVLVEAFAKKLMKTLDKQATVLIQPRYTALQDKIDKQAKDVWEGLSKSLKLFGLSDKNLVLIGDKEGALVAMKLLEKYPDGIIGIITHQSPLLGLDIEKIKAFREELNDTSPGKLGNQVDQLVSQFSGLGVKNFSKDAIANGLRMFDVKHEGIADINTASPTIASIKEQLANSPVPILMVGGKGATLPAFFSIGAVGELDYKKLEEMLAPLSTFPQIGALIYKIDTMLGDRNDGLVSLNSQHAKTVEGENIKRVKYKGPRSRVSQIADEDEIYKQMCDFINDLFQHVK